MASKEQCWCMGAKFSVLPQRNETDAQMSERGTLAVYSERLVTIGCQLVVCRHTRARVVPPPFELRAGGDHYTPLPKGATVKMGWPHVKVGHELLSWPLVFRAGGYVDVDTGLLDEKKKRLGNGQ